MEKRSKKEKVVRKSIPAKNVVASDALQSESLLSRDWFRCLVLLTFVFLAYSPVWWAGYVWDDDAHLTANRCIIGPLGLKEIWTTGFADICPLTLTTFWLEHALWGLSPLPYHLVNVVLHGVDAILLWRVLRSLQVVGAWFGAALWALHPVQVESVAWISEMKNTESCLFYLLCIRFFIEWLKTMKNRDSVRLNWDYMVMLLFAALAMASKSSTVVLPGVLCLVAWWIEGRWQWRNLAIVTPVLSFSIFASVASVWIVHFHGADTDPQWLLSWPERFVVSGKVVWFYLAKLVWPYPLIAFYPRWQIDVNEWFSYLPLAATIIVGLVLWLNRVTWARLYFLAGLYFVVALLPVLGFVNHQFLHYSFVANHFQYLASMGPLVLMGGGMVWLGNFLIPSARSIRFIVGTGILLALGIASWHRAWVYEDKESFWNNTLANNPDCWLGYYDLGNELQRKGQFDKAIARYRKAIEVYPNYAEAHSNLGTALERTGQIDEAIYHYKKTLEINPNIVVAHYDLGVLLEDKGEINEAVDDFKMELKIEPNLAPAHFELGTCLVKKGETAEAISEFQEALRLKPDYIEAQISLANARAMMSR